HRRGAYQPHAQEAGTRRHRDGARHGLSAGATVSRPISLQRRLGVGLTLGVVSLWLVATALTVFIVQHAIDKTLDSSLEETAQRILSLAVVEIFNREGPNLLQQVAALRPHEEYITYVVRGADGAPLLMSHDVDLAVFPATPRVGLRGEDSQVDIVG